MLVRPYRDADREAVNAVAPIRGVPYGRYVLAAAVSGG
jgi:hypothetical protein